MFSRPRVFAALAGVLVLATPLPAQPLAPNTAGPERAPADLNMELIGRFDPVGGGYGDVWGYVDPATGREYALLCGRYSGLFVVDLTDANGPGDEPVQVGYVQGLADSKDVKVYGHHAYFVNENAPVQIVDLADPTDPQLVGTLDTQPNVPGGGAHNAWVDGEHLYVIGGRSPGGLRVYSLADPAAPAFVGEYQPTYYHDLYVKDGVGYASAIYNEGVDVLDLSDPADPRPLVRFTYPAAYMGAHNACTTEDGNYVFIGDEIGSEPHTRVFDVRDLDNVELVADIVISDGPSHNCYVLGDQLYIANYTDGVRVFDVSDPTSPVEVAFYDTFPQDGSGYSGAWTAYPYLPSGKVIASNLEDGLWVLRQTGTVAEAPAPSAPVAAGLTLGGVFPNPASTEAAVRLTLTQPAAVTVAVYDVLGRRVAAAEAALEVGAHDVALDVGRLAPGAYVYRVEAAGAARTGRLTLVR